MNDSDDLVKKAQMYHRVRPRNNYGPSDIELAVAWVNGKVTTSGAIVAWDVHQPSEVYLRVAMALKTGIVDGKVVVDKK